MCKFFSSNIIDFLNAHSVILANSVDPDQPACSGSTLFFKQFMLCCILILKLFDVRMTKSLVFTC